MLTCFLGNCLTVRVRAGEKKTIFVVLGKRVYFIEKAEHPYSSEVLSSMFMITRRQGCSGDKKYIAFSVKQLSEEGHTQVLQALIPSWQSETEGNLVHARRVAHI